MTLRLLPAANVDILESARWYQDREPGLGLAFVSEIDSVFQRIEQGPQRFPLAHLQLRRALVRRFPYAVYFEHNAEDIIVLAVLHQRRERKVLDERLKE